MPAVQESADQDFYRLIHRVVATREADQASERRTQHRTPFRCVQRIAPYVDGQLPFPSAFRDVQCYDISSGGFSFLSPCEPEFKLFVAAFGTDPEIIYLTARVAHTSSVQLYTCGIVERLQPDGQPSSHCGPRGCNRETMFLVGCKFMGRVFL